MAPSPAGPGSDVLEESWRELRAAGEEAEALAAGLGPRRLGWRPGPESWSIAECLDHLVLSGEAYLEALDPAIQGARRAGRLQEGAYRPSLVGRWLPRLLEPPPRLKLTAPRRIRPRSPRPEASPPGRKAGSSPGPLRRFLDLRDRLRRRLEAADGLDLGGVRIASPFVPWLRFDLGSAFRILAAHERRHLWQARRVREHEGFPRG